MGHNTILNIRSLAILSMGAFFIVPLLLTSQAFATNEYIAGYRDSSTVHHPYQFLGYINFAGSTSVTSYTGGVISMAGWGSTSPTPMVYQAPTTLETNSNIQGDSQVWNGATQSWYSPLALGHFGSASTDINYVYYTFYWNSARNTVTFYYEPHFNDGTYTGKYVTYSKVSGDTSTNFAAGWQDVSLSGSTYRIKYLQFGTESGSSTSGWRDKQYDMTYYCSDGSCTTVNLSSVVGRSLLHDQPTHTYESWITYSGSTPYQVGGANYVANADYHLKTGSTLPAGQVQWYKDPTQLPAGTQLW